MKPLSALVATAALGAGILLSACGSSGGVATTTTSQGTQPPPSSSSSATLPATGGTQQTITVVGTGTVTVKPDMAVLDIGVTMTGGSAADAVRFAASAGDALANSLVGSGVARNDISTTSYSVQPHWNPSTQRNEGWECHNGFTAVLHDVSKTGTVIANATVALPNVLTVGSVQLQVSNREAASAPARTAAMQDARTHAAAWAKLAGKTLGDVVSVSEQQGSAAYQLPGQGMGGGGGAGIQTGVGQFSVSVTVVFAVS